MYTEIDQSLQIKGWVWTNESSWLCAVFSAGAFVFAAAERSGGRLQQAGSVSVWKPFLRPLWLPVSIDMFSFPMCGIIIIITACAFFLSAQPFPDGWRPGGPGVGAEQIQPVWYRRLRLLLGSDQVPPGPQGSAGVTRHLEQLPINAEDTEEIQLYLPHVSHRSQNNSA